jgi:dsRNA-specific ribonuclease
MAVTKQRAVAERTPPTMSPEHVKNLIWCLHETATHNKFNNNTQAAFVAGTFHGIIGALYVDSRIADAQYKALRDLIQKVWAGQAYPTEAEATLQIEEILW